MANVLFSVGTMHSVKFVGKSVAWYCVQYNLDHHNIPILKSEEAGEEDTEEAPDYGFGMAKHFMPLPNAVVGSHCAWEIRLNTLEGRIPGDGNRNKHSLTIILLFDQTPSLRSCVTLRVTSAGALTTSPASR